jgi:ribose transport system permease protein
MAAQTNPASSGVVGVEDFRSDAVPSLWSKILSAQPFWVTVTVILICAVMTYLQPDSFATADNFFNITRNFAYIGIMALGMTAVIITGGIDLSVGSIMGLAGVICGLVLQAQHPWWVARRPGCGLHVRCGSMEFSSPMCVCRPSSSRSACCRRRGR